MPEGGITVKGECSESYMLLEKKAPDGYVITDNETAF